LSDTDLNIIFKAHPWENKKKNLLHPRTKEKMHDIFGESPRVIIVEDYAISDLFSEVDYVAVINSQLGIEAALQGFKPLQIGNAFYGGYGFTYDIDKVDTIIDVINSELSGRLSIDEYILLREYLMHMLVDYLVPEEVATGTAKLKQIFNIAPIKKVAPPNKIIDKPISVENKPAPSVNKNASTGNKKLNKLKRNPKRFFSDSKFVVLRSIGKIL